MMRELRDLALLILASPVYFALWVFEALGGWNFWTVAYTPRVTCPNCENEISLVGLWRCHCGYTYRGHLLRKCPVCHTTPIVARCYRCGVTRKLPER